MKTSRIVHFATLALVFGFVALACAAQDRPSNDKDHPKQDNKQVRPEQQHTQQPRSSADKRPSAQQEQRGNQSPHQTEQSRPAAHQQNRATTKQEHTSASHGATRPQQDQGRGVQQAAWQQHSASNWQSDHRTWQQRGGYHGYRIPDTRYRGYFGPGHAFLIRGLPFMVVGGFPRFQYNGYWLSVVDPWPQQWGNDWYDNDQVYVDYADGGYYLYNRSYPGIGIAVSISM
ncbi:MAG: hypothetical protein WBG54_04515 [Acidobacteriaceae bacterium]